MFCSCGIGWGCFIVVLCCLGFSILCLLWLLRWLRLVVVIVVGGLGNWLVIVYVLWIVD